MGQWTRDPGLSWLIKMPRLSSTHRIVLGLVGLSTTNFIGELISAVVGAVVFIYVLRYLKKEDLG